jgi:hypothetical protein
MLLKYFGLRSHLQLHFVLCLVEFNTDCRLDQALIRIMCLPMQTASSSASPSRPMSSRLRLLKLALAGLVLTNANLTAEANALRQQQWERARPVTSLEGANTISVALRPKLDKYGKTEASSMVTLEMIIPPF